jgi:hypothetical protein
MGVPFYKQQPFVFLHDKGYKHCYWISRKTHPWDKDTCFPLKEAYKRRNTEHPATRPPTPLSRSKGKKTKKKPKTPFESRSNQEALQVNSSLPL